VHSTLGQTPAAVWSAGTAATPPITVTGETAFLVDFLPVIRRTLTRTGFVIDHVRYFSDALKPWIARRDRLDRFVLRRDPRDLSRIWVLDPDGGAYLEVPYRTLAHPPVTLWEQQAAVARLREQGRAQVDETALFRMVEQMRTITDTAAATTRRARRDAQRRAAVPAARVAAPTNVVPPPEPASPVAVEPFAVIEEW
jgi:putative transposase